jgi:pSer/pThr/pTyr-binding forkhead associated (FHA) protein
VVTHGHPRGQVIEVAQADVIIGSHPDSDVILASPYLSRSHLRVSQDGSGTWATDLRTIGGTTVNGTRIHRPTLLHDGDEVGLGGITLVYEAGADPAVPAEPQATSRIPRPHRR